MGLHRRAQNFVGRFQELELLQNSFVSGKAQFIPIYGRRRTGKSELVLQFIKNKTSIYYVGKKASAELQKKEFVGEAAVALQEPLWAHLQQSSWKEILTAVALKASRDKPLILAFDEFQWTVESSPELPSVLQELWDTTWKKQNNLFLILCGSYIGFMEKEILGQKSPLFGRRTAQILLKPLGYLEAALFHPQYALNDQAAAYFICGGIPAYLNMFDQNVSIASNIANNFLNEFAPLFREPDFLLREELRDVERYYTILMAIAQGLKSMSAITQYAGLDERRAYYYLQSLVELNYVGRKYPLVSRSPQKHEVRFEIIDPMLRFWFYFVYPSQSYILRAGAEEAFKHKVQPSLENYFGHCFETLCREALPNLYQKEKVLSEYAVGEYWNKHCQIDVIGLRKDKVIDIGECKWGKTPSLSQARAELESKIKNYPNLSKATLFGRLFTKAALKLKMDSTIRNHTLEDIYLRVDSN